MYKVLILFFFIVSCTSQPKVNRNLSSLEKNSAFISDGIKFDNFKEYYHIDNTPYTLTLTNIRNREIAFKVNSINTNIDFDGSTCDTDSNQNTLQASENCSIVVAPINRADLSQENELTIKPYKQAPILRHIRFVNYNQNFCNSVNRLIYNNFQSSDAKYSHWEKYKYKNPAVQRNLKGTFANDCQIIMEKYRTTDNFHIKSTYQYCQNTLSENSYLKAHKIESFSLQSLNEFDDEVQILCDE